MASSDQAVDQAAARELGRILTGTAAARMADRLAEGDTLTGALRVLGQAERALVRPLLAKVSTPARIAVLRAIEGALSTPSMATPIWTMPGPLGRSGPLTSSVAHIVDGARQSITCSTFNFQPTSQLWQVLADASKRAGMQVRVYIDTGATGINAPAAEVIAAQLRPAIVLRTKEFDGAIIRNHAKFLAIDHRFLLVTSANFSWSAERHNVEFGVLVDDRALTEAVERELRSVEPLLYERVMWRDSSAT
ncbi:DISARM system phospholipase D-like protein DrmC [Catenulispora sp. GP43]|uniref:DISARM system phospholipase D-like protein DrmC n=1 Tax=Catenulispora sp. GP43 TaxID=3156263 RepID=UPI003513F835